MSKARLGPLLVALPLLLGSIVSLSPRRASATTDRDACLEACLARCDEEDEQRQSGCLDLGPMVEDSCRPDCEYGSEC